MPCMKNETAVLIAVAFFLPLLGMSGCRRDEGSALPKAQGNSAVASGKTVFDANGCAKCHPVGGQGSHGGPDLAHIGAKPGYTVDQLMLKVRYHPRVPGFQGPTSARDVVALGGYLAGLK